MVLAGKVWYTTLTSKKKKFGTQDWDELLNSVRVQFMVYKVNDAFKKR